MTDTPAPTPPKTMAAAIKLLERFSALGGELAATEANRSAAIAATNKVADALALPVLTEMAKIHARIEPWWPLNKAELTKGKRKSVELAGCMIGSKLGNTVLEHGFASDELALAALQAARWARPYVSVKYSIDRAATLSALDGAHKERLAALGFKATPGADNFFLKPVAQQGSVSAT
ncbi:hypothetical protein BH10PSE14_BH10PSE14_04500 [soil metagenome]